ncbi:MAG: hypothetical protein ABI140_13470 [Jatrophihabitantaceae bacterium]
MRRLIALGFAMVAGLWLAGPAAAATPTLHVTPSSVAAGGSAQVSGTCEANTDGFALSHAFLHDSGHDFAGVGAVAFHTDASGVFSATAQVPASIPAGSYSVTGRCGGGNLGITATLTVTAAAGGVPTAVPAGSGGLAATTSAGTERAQLAVAGAGLVLLLAGGLGARRLRRSHPHAH